MKHLFIQGKMDRPCFLVLHGTGGTERDLLPIAEAIDPGASMLTVRGNVEENGMARYFARLSEGFFDLEDLRKRTFQLDVFLNDVAKTHGFMRNNLIALGYSNGANIAGSMLFEIKDAFRGAILFHPMVPRRDVTLPDLTGVPIFIAAGRNDPLCSVEETTELVSILENAHADVTVAWFDQGHQLSWDEVKAASTWYDEHILD